MRRGVEAFGAHGGGRIEADTVVSGDSYDVARLAAGAVADAVDRVMKPESKTGLCLGAAAGASCADGRCDGVLSVQQRGDWGRALATDDYQLDRVLIVDWDVHHGNGTQDAILDGWARGILLNPSLAVLSGTGDRDETGSGAGLGTTLNLPIEFELHAKSISPSFAMRWKRLLIGFDRS